MSNHENFFFFITGYIKGLSNDQIDDFAIFHGFYKNRFEKSTMKFTH